jgi:hypothetical protein
LTDLTFFTVDWSTLFWIFVLAMAASHPLMWWLRRKPRWHRGLMYTATLIGGLTLVSGTYDSRERLAVWQKAALEPVLPARFALFAQQVKWEREYYCETHFVRSEYSPPNFDQLEREQKVACDLMTQISRRTQNDGNAKAPITLPELNGRLFQEGGMLKQSADALQDSAGSYNEVVNFISRLEQEEKPTPFRTTLLYFGPYLLTIILCIALGGIAFPAEDSSARKSTGRNSQSRPRNRPRKKDAKT